MKDSRKKSKFTIICSALLFAAIMLMEFYIIINEPDMILAIMALGILDLICICGVIYGFLSLQEHKELRHEEQYDSIFKSEKASYLLLKKHFEEIEQRLIELEDKTAVVPNGNNNDVVNAQKTAAKLIISRSKENADAILSATDIIMDSLDEMKGTLNAQNDNLQKQCGQDIEGQVKEILLAMKDMELRLNNAIHECQKSISQIPTNVTYQAPPVHYSANTQTRWEEPVMEEPAIEEPMVEEPIIEEPVIEDPVIEEPVIEEPVIEEPIIEEPVIEEPIIEEPIIEESVIEEPMVEETPAMPDLSDPNKMMSPDDIAALLASMNGDSIPQEEPVVEEPVAEEPVIEEPVVEEPVEEEKPPMPDLSDPNKVMTPEEIAALIANL